MSMRCQLIVFTIVFFVGGKENNEKFVVQEKHQLEICISSVAHCSTVNCSVKRIREKTQFNGTRLCDAFSIAFSPHFCGKWQFKREGSPIKPSTLDNLIDIWTLQNNSGEIALSSFLFTLRSLFTNEVVYGSIRIILIVGWKWFEIAWNVHLLATWLAHCPTFKPWNWNGSACLIAHSLSILWSKCLCNNHKNEWQDAIFYFHA